MKCSRTFELLSRRLDHQLAHREREALRRHLSSCEACRELQAKVESDSVSVKRALHFTKPDLRQFVAKTMAYITEIEEPHTPASVNAARSEDRSRAAWILAQSVGLAASIAVIAYLSFVQGPDLSNQITRLEGELSETRGDLKAALLQIDREDQHLVDGGTSIVPAEQLPDRSGNTDVEHASMSEDESSALSIAVLEKGGELDLEMVAPTRSAETLVSDLVQAIEQGDTATIEQLSSILFDLREKAETVADLLAESYRDEPDAAKRAQLLDVMSEFATEGQQSFYLDELTRETDVPLRRALTEGMARLLMEGNYPLTGATDQLRQILNNPGEDFAVRAFAAEALFGDALSRGDHTLFQEISAEINAAEDLRFREKVVVSIAKNIPGAGNQLSSSISDFLVDYVNNERDYSTNESVLNGLQSATYPGEAIRILDRLKHRSDLERRFKRAREVLQLEQDRTIMGGGE